MEAADHRRLTEHDLEDVEDDGDRHELTVGFLLREPPPGLRHGRIQLRLAEALSAFARSRGLGEVVPDVGFVLAKDPDTVRQPDVAFIDASKLAGVLDDSRRFPGAPDLAIEILSPSDRPAEVHGKVADFLAAGTRAVWLVDPSTRSVTVYRTLLEPKSLAGADSLEGEDFLPGFSIAVAAIFS